MYCTGFLVAGFYFAQSKTSLPAEEARPTR